VLLFSDEKKEKIVAPFVTRVHVVSEGRGLKQIRERLERITDPNIVKSRVKFCSFKNLGNLLFPK